jgi:hypothetical protein
VNDFMKWRKGLIPVVSVVGLAVPLAMSPTTATATVAVVHAPRIPLNTKTALHFNSGWASANWSGYAITGGTYNSITGEWIVPTVQRTSRPTYSSTWIGIDGFNNSDLIQTGTEQDYYNGSAHYYAWWEILPAPETVIPSMTIHPGDRMYADIENLGGGLWSITIKDLATGQSFTTQQYYSGPQTSAEWIEEAPTVGSRIATLAHYGQTTLDPGTVNGGNPNLTASDGGVLIQNGSQVSTPSNPDSDTDGFNVAYGSAQPSPPAS